MNDKLLLYLHIPKTGGSSFTQAINENCPNIVHFHTLVDGIQLSERLVNADALCGHFIYGIHQFTDRPYQYITMLRHPLERTLSHFYFKYKNPEYDVSYDEDLTFEEYVLNPYYDIEYCNLQARMITGELNNPYPNYQKARDLLDNQFAFVGLTELYDISLFLLMQRLNWKLTHYPKVNVTPNRPSYRSLSSEAVSNVIQKNEIDRNLYEHACQRFNEHVLDLSSKQEKQLKAYLRAARM
ncbi:Sulfotransferase family protein [Paenibacillus catalpae]|uniref:Sulfotransferase family protein n=1 Tax=Paenibacillus catalpae TaxID=1045775 RepID=A0A1I1YUQ1_9BACL|nr:sulfotransferase family 2 domain-containing protein [Paenibacillus catalpae]SFE23315.1 Sulfotransferase family protein [Paenibacillus catalpae]